jgi:hypothetical protein
VNPTLFVVLVVKRFAGRTVVLGKVGTRLSAL